MREAARRTCRDDSGAVAVIVVFFILMALILAAMVIDFGYWYSVKRQLQAAADAAALAGCQEIIRGGSSTEALSVAEKYAEGDASDPYNAVNPAQGLQMVPPGVLDASGTAYTEVTDTYIKVTVTKTAPTFIARIWGRNDGQLAAQAKAKIGYLTGLKNLVPWSVPIVRAKSIWVSVDGGSPQYLTKGTTGKWEGDLTAPGYGVHTVEVIAENEFGVPEKMSPAATIVVQEPSAPVRSVRLSKQMMTAGTSAQVTLTVETTPVPLASAPRARFDGKNMTLTPLPGADGTYYTRLAVPVSDSLIAHFPVDVSVDTTKGGGTYSITSAAVLNVRRSTYPIRNVTFSPCYLWPSSGPTHVTVDLNEYVYGDTYTLKVVGGAGEIGNFLAVDFAEVKHPPYWQKSDPSEYDLTTDPDYAPPAYYNYIEKRFPFPIHIGDTLWTQTGVLSGPTTVDSILERFGTDTTYFRDWDLAGQPGSTRLIYVPVVEKLQEITGQSAVKVVALAAFYVEPDSGIYKSDCVVTGRFVKYLAPSDSVSDTPPPSGYYIMTPRLTSEGLSF